MPIAKPPIVPKVAAVIGTYAEKVENRSLLLDKFIIHKSWPSDDVLRGKLDDAVRWSLIRCTENGADVLLSDKKKNKAIASGQYTKPEKKHEAERRVQILDKLTPCGCRRLSTTLEEMRKAHVNHLIDLVERSSFGHRVLLGRLESRLAVNLSGSLIQNAGICLDRLFGVPYLPGSAVKGVCRHVALEALRTGRMSFHDFQDIFGTADVDFKETRRDGDKIIKGGELEAFRKLIGQDGIVEDKKGCIDFLAAFSRNEPHLTIDLTNVHFPDYYKSGNEGDLGQEKPRPNPFPVVEVGAEFAFCIALNSMGGRLESDERRKAMMDKAESILHRAMEVSGFGAKTGAGYGWFTDLTPELRRIAAQEEAQKAERERIAAEEEKRRQEEERRRQSLSPEEREAEDRIKAVEELQKLPDEAFAGFAKALREKTRPEILAFCELLRNVKKDRWKTWKKKKPDLAVSIRDAAKSVGVELS